MDRVPLDVVLDTDAYNEIDDQFAIAYLLRAGKRLNTQAIYAAPFHNSLSNGPGDGMEKSYQEIFHILSLCGREDIPVFRGSDQFLPDEHTAVASPAALDLARRAMAYSPENPLYVIAIGAITNVASALLTEPAIRDRICVVWLGGHAHHWHDTVEFNMKQDYAAARIVMGSGADFVQLPCKGVVSEFATTAPELEALLFNKNPLADYLARNTVRFMEQKGHTGIWSKPIWDVTAVAWLLNNDSKFMFSRREAVRLPGYDGHYESPIDKTMTYIYSIRRDALMTDLVAKLTEAEK